MDEHVFLSFEAFLIFTMSLHGIGYANRILSMNTAQLSQCSRSVIEKVTTTREIVLRRFKGKDM